MLSFQFQPGIFPGLKPPVSNHHKLVSFKPDIFPGLKPDIFLDSKPGFEPDIFPGLKTEIFSG